MKKVFVLFCIVALGALASCGAKKVVDDSVNTVEDTAAQWEKMVEEMMDTGKEAAEKTANVVENTYVCDGDCIRAAEKTQEAGEAMAEKVEDTAQDMKEGAEEMMEKTQEAGETMMEKTKAEGEKAVEDVKEAVKHEGI